MPSPCPPHRGTNQKNGGIEHDENPLPYPEAGPGRPCGRYLRGGHPDPAHPAVHGRPVPRGGGPDGAALPVSGGHPRPGGGLLPGQPAGLSHHAGLDLRHAGDAAGRPLEPEDAQRVLSRPAAGCLQRGHRGGGNRLVRGAGRRGFLARLWAERPHRGIGGAGGVLSSGRASGKAAGKDPGGPGHPGGPLR